MTDQGADSKNSPSGNDADREPKGSEADLRRLLEECYLRLEDDRDIDLDEICAAHPELRGRLERLLEHESEVMARVVRTRPPSAKLRSQTIAGYVLHRKIGAGGMGEVYAAHDPSLGRDIALKIVSRLGSDDVAMRRLKREAEITATLDHPNIVPVYAVGEDDDVAWIAMKLLTGPSLAGLGQTLSPREAASIGAAIARGLHAAHVEGVIHRDVKPANIVLDNDRAVLCDFGLARALDRMALTQSNAVAGTLPYMAPEQLDGTGSTDPRADVYGLCATLYEIVSGRPPFVAPNPELLVRQIVDRDPLPLPIAKSDSDFGTIVRRGLDKTPSRRFPTALDLAEDLERYLAGDAIDSRPSGMFDTIIRRMRRRPRTMIAAALFILLIAAAWIWISSAEKAQLEFDREQLLRAKTAADRGFYDIAEESLRDLERRRPDLEGLADEMHRREGLEALDEFVNEMQTVLRSWSPYFEEKKRRVIDLGAEHLRRPLSDLAFVVADINKGEEKNALARLDIVVRDFGPSRSVAALRLVAETRILRSQEPLPAPRRLSVDFDEFDDIVFAVIAMRLGGAPIDERQREIDEAVARSPGRYRLLYAKGVQYHDTDKHEAAYALWLGMHKNGRYSPTIVDNLALSSIVLGRFDRASQHLADVADKPRYRYLVRRSVEFTRMSPAAMNLKSAIERGIETFPDDPWFPLQLGFYHLERRNFDEAQTQFDIAILKCVNDPRIEHNARLGKATLELGRNGWDSDRTFSIENARNDKITALRNECHDLVSGAPTRQQKSDAYVLSARFARLCFDFAGAWTTIEDALIEDPRNPAAMVAKIVDMGRRCLLIVQTGEDPLAAADIPLESEMIECDRLLDDLITSRTSGVRRATHEQVVASLEASLVFALPSRDKKRYLEAEERIQKYLGTVPITTSNRLATYRKFLDL